MKQAQPLLILASESPRRKQLLLEAGFQFSVIPSKVSEIPDENLNINDQILDIARRKATAIVAESLSLQSSEKTEFIVIAADTEVIFAGKPLGKPQNKADAFRILRLLSGNAHEVKTAICLIHSQTLTEVSQVETTKIIFKSLSDAEIWSYIETEEPLDKAGAYAIQGLGRNFVAEFEGSFDNVVGLPIQVLKLLLEQIGFIS
jgi:septum formation protein